MTTTDAPSPSSVAPAYRVLARKYRPTDFSTLIGQEAMVRTLGNAMQSGRLAHAFLLTGVRGVGKTTTARIIARALNCIGPDGQGGPTVAPCGVCEHCRAIAEDRHVDVLELDAASRTGVGDMREIIDGVRYRPTSARYKVYIIDEVHMLSLAAFNALLKTLEEPPEHVKFIFATTETRKIPITVLSRCQRFDLRRVEVETLAAHFGRIVEQEGATIDAPSLQLIARAADGSVRDGLSLLDQAIAHGGGNVTEDQVRKMLCLADRSGVMALFAAALRGDVVPALDRLTEHYTAGADPATVIQGGLELIHWLTRLKLDPKGADASFVSQDELKQGQELAQTLGVARLTRGWQMVLKGLAEVRSAPNPLQAAEMVLIRLAYAADLPTPADLARQIKANPAALTATTGALPGGAVGSAGSQTAIATTAASQPESVPPTMTAGNTALALKTDNLSTLPGMPHDFAAVVALFQEHRESLIAVYLRSKVRLVACRAGHLEFNPVQSLPHDFCGKVKALLELWTGRSWIVSVNALDPGLPPLMEQEQTDREQERRNVMTHPLVAAALQLFPGATVAQVIPHPTTVVEAPADMPPSDFESLSGDDLL